MSTGPVERSASPRPEDSRLDAPDSTAPSAPVMGASTPADPVPARPVAPAAERAPEPAAPARRSEPAAEEVEEVGGSSMSIGVWIALILGAIVLVMLLIFIVQNNVTTQFEYLGTQFSLPLGVAMLLAAIAGALVMAAVGSVRMLQMAWTIRKLRKAQDKIRRAAQ